MLWILAEKGVSGPFTVPEAMTGDKVIVSSFFGKDLVLQLQQPGNTRIYAYKVSKNGLKMKTGPEIYGTAITVVSPGTYIVIARPNGTWYDHTVYTSKLKKVGTMALKNIGLLNISSLTEITMDTTNTMFRIFTW
jgi:hypothetical protein